MTNYCYRFKALASVYDSGRSTGGNFFVNGYFRLHPIALQGTSSFKIEWTDGSVDGAGELNWFGGPLNMHGGGANPDPNMEIAGASIPASLAGDNYDALFSYVNRRFWPKALRITMHVVDPGTRLKGGRDFVQIVNLPN